MNNVFGDGVGQAIAIVHIEGTIFALLFASHTYAVSVAINKTILLLLTCLFRSFSGIFDFVSILFCLFPLMLVLLLLYFFDG